MIMNWAILWTNHEFKQPHDMLPSHTVSPTKNLPCTPHTLHMAPVLSTDLSELVSDSDYLCQLFAPDVVTSSLHSSFLFICLCLFFFIVV